MIEAATPVQRQATPEAQGLRSRTRTCVGCTERVDLQGPGGADLVRLVLGPGGEIAVDASPRGRSASGRGAHVHARRACVDRAARAGLLRATKGAARFIIEAGEPDKSEALSTDSLARAIQRTMDRRIEGLLAAAVRSRQLSRSGEASLVVVACDVGLLDTHPPGAPEPPGAAADLTGVRRAVVEGRAVAWGTRERIGAIVAPAPVRGRLAPPAPEPRGSEGVGVIAIASRTIAEALRTAVQAASAVTSLEVTTTGARPPNPRHPQAGSQARPGNGRGKRGPVGPGGAKRARDRRDG